MFCLNISNWVFISFISINAVCRNYLKIFIIELEIFIYMNIDKCKKKYEYILIKIWILWIFDNKIFVKWGTDKRKLGYCTIENLQKKRETCIIADH